MAGRIAADFATDTIVVGAGAVGLACARAMARRGHEVIVLEAATQIGQGVSSRNSEVLHAGIYYPTGSLKAALCVAGNRLIRDFSTTHAIALDPCGKLAVATTMDDLPALAAIEPPPAANGPIVSPTPRSFSMASLPSRRATSTIPSPRRSPSRSAARC